MCECQKFWVLNDNAMTGKGFSLHLQSMHRTFVLKGGEQSTITISNTLYSKLF